MGAAASGGELHARGERVMVGPSSFGQLPNCDELGGESSRQDDASRRDLGGCRVWGRDSWDWQGSVRAGAVGGVEQPKAGGDGSSGWLNEPGGGLGPSGGEDRLVMASFAEAANRGSGPLDDHAS